MANWVIRQVSDGLFWSGGGWREHLRDAYVWSQCDHDGEALKDPYSRLCNDGEEWVELDDAGQPVEPSPVAQGANAGPVIGWVITDGNGFYERGSGLFVRDLELAASWPCKQHVWSSGQTSVAFGHREDGSRFLLLTEPAPAEEPSPEDEPIPYRLADTDDRDNLIARIAVQYERAARHVRKAAKLEKRLAKVAS